MKKWGKTKERLALLIQQAIPNTEVTSLVRAYGTLYSGVAIWAGYAKYIDGPHDGLTFSFCSWSTMTECVKNGISIDYYIDRGDFDPQKFIPCGGIEISSN